MSSKTQMQVAFDQIIEMYHHYAKLDNDVLDKQEFKKMMEEQFPDCLKNARNPEGVEKFFDHLDKDKSNSIDFVEYMTLIAKYLICAHEKFHGHEGGHQPHSHPHGHPHCH